MRQAVNQRTTAAIAGNRAVTRMVAIALAAMVTSVPAGAAAVTSIDGKALAHPLINGSQDSGCKLWFVQEAGGVMLYTQDCPDRPGARLVPLDQLGAVEVRSVFYAALDHDPDVDTLLVLLRHQGKHSLRAYRYHENAGRYRRLDALQPALDRIAAGQATLNAARVKAALAQLTPYDYSVVRGQSGIAAFDAIDHTQGSLVGYYDRQGRPVPASSEEAAVYKKTFQQQGARYLTASYTLYGEHSTSKLPNYRLWQVGWESVPRQYAGSSEGAAVIYSLNWDDNDVVERGQYRHGKRSGEWVRNDSEEGSARGAYVDGLQEGPWHYESMHQSEDGVYRAGKREGRWTTTINTGEDEVNGFDTYAGGQLNGPHEQRVGGKLRSRGNYVNGTRQGLWLTDEGQGAYLDGMRDGPWQLQRRVGTETWTVAVGFVQGKKHGVLTETDGRGTLRLREDYLMDVADGERIRYGVNGAVIYRATLRNGVLDGQERAYDDRGKVLLRDMHWKMGKKVGTASHYYADGKPEILAEIDREELVTWLRQYAQDGQLINDIRRCHFTEYDRERNDVCDYHRMYFANGQPQYDYLFQFGERQEGREWYANGRVKQELLVDRERDTSVWNTYFDSGQLQCTEPRSGHSKRTVNGQPLISYASARRDGERICYHRNGQVASRRSYNKGPAVDCGKEFDDTGRQTAPGPEGCPVVKKTPWVFGE